MKIMAAAMAQHGGDRETARFLWSRIYESAEDPSIRTNAAQHLRALQVADEVEALEKLVAAYRQRTGHAPASFEDLIAAGMLRTVPRDPLGRPYRLGADGKARVADASELP